LKIAETYHRITQQSFDRNKYSTFNSFSPKATIIRHRDDIRETTALSTIAKEVEILNIDMDTSNKIIEKLT